ncbi:HET-domain-containing protein, partial [Karstenula rhodostoma CBS 690.94]
MRLINVRDGSFKEFIGTQIPEYAILSHTWEDEEVTYKDVMENVHKGKMGFAKIEMTCRIAASEGIDWAWVDTCCIDKSSSAELTEAINSMYLWYKRSKVCYAYLGDLTGFVPFEEALPQCRWFTRGWTLQELIGPQNLFFYDREWNVQGHKSQLGHILKGITGIRISILRGLADLSTIAVAEKMSWAAHRQTTRIEDTAYCLLGLFDINIPLLYGEEEKAFVRLQEEIIKTTNDRSIFAW